MSNKADRDNRANQLNPNNDAYWSSRGDGTSEDPDDDACVGDTMLTTWRSPPPVPAPQRVGETETFEFPSQCAVVVRFATMRGTRGTFRLEGGNRAKMLERLRQFWEAKDLVWLQVRDHEVILSEERDPSGPWKSQATKVLSDVKNPSGDDVVRNPWYYRPLSTDMRAIEQYLASLSLPDR